MKARAIYLTGAEPLESVRSQILTCTERRVVVVLPERGQVFESRFDLVLLLRTGQEMGIQVGIVSADAEIRSECAMLEIPVFKTVGEAQRAPWRKKRTRRFLMGKTIRQRREIIKAHQIPAISTGSKRDSELLRRIFFVVGVLALFALMSLFLPSARVELTLQRQEQSLLIPVIARLNLKSPSLAGGIPAIEKTVIVEGADQISVSGTMLSPDRSASGIVYISSLTGQDEFVPAGTVVLTIQQPAVRFRTQSDVMVSGGPGGPTPVLVKAVEAGSLGNVNPGQIQAIEGDIGLRVTVINEQPTVGGSDRVAPMPDEGDYQTVYQRLMAQLQDQAMMQLGAELENGVQILEGSLRVKKVLAERRSPEKGMPGDTLKLGLRVEFAAWSVGESDILQGAEMALNASLPSGMTAIPETTRLVTRGNPQLADGQYRWEIQVIREIQPRVPQWMAANTAAGRSLRSAQQNLKALAPMEKEPEIRISPFWWRRMPFFPYQISVEVN